MPEGGAGKQRKNIGIALIIICVLAVAVGVVFCFVAYIRFDGDQGIPAMMWVMILVILPAGIAGLAKGLSIVTQ